MKAVALVSGGLDSVTLAHLLLSEGYELHLLSCDYGQRHLKELGFASACAERLGAQHDVVDLTGVGRLLSGSALTDDLDVPDGHYAHESMRVTVVPNRNAILLAVAYGAAVAEAADIVAYAAHGGDHFIYPDCRPAFADVFDRMERLANEGCGDVRLYTPFIHMTKAEIVTVGVRLDVPLEQTWSCYKGGALHCGRCGTCVERKEAFHAAGVTDKTDYADAEDASRAHR
jgi:7-cyano-7-deazaguanine synthase